MPAVEISTDEASRELGLIEIEIPTRRPDVRQLVRLRKLLKGEVEVQPLKAGSAVPTCVACDKTPRIAPM